MGNLDIRARDLLGRIQSLKAEESIIAGGACRDIIFEKVPVAYDFFVPYKEYHSITDAIHKVVVYDFKKSPDCYNVMMSSVSGTYEGLKFTIRGFEQNKKSENSFSEQVLNTFDYGINRTWYEDSSGIKTTEDFNSDRDRGYLTLLALRRISELPWAMNRFHKIVERLGPGWSFKCPILELKGQKEEESKLTSTSTWGQVLQPAIAAGVDNIVREEDRRLMQDAVDRAHRAQARLRIPQPIPAPIDWAALDGPERGF